VAGVGIDLLDIARLERALERRPRLAERLFTDGERSYAEGKAQPARHLAARFCAKEAVVKALALSYPAFLEIEVVATATAPEVRLSGGAAERAGALGAKPVISLTHTDTTAGAVALLVAE